MLTPDDPMRPEPNASSVADLSELERDALTELVNIAISGAAVRLRALVGSEVTLTVPSVTVAGGDEASRATHLGVDRVLAIRQGFSGRLSGQTMLMFPEDDSAMLVRAILGAEHSEADCRDLANDTLAEVGNILLLGFLATVGSMLRLTFSVGLPQVDVSDAQMDLFPQDREHAVLVIYVNFEVRRISARGYFSLVLGLGTFAELREIVGAFVTDLMKGA